MNNKKYKHLFELDMLKAYYKLDHIEQIRLQDNYVVPRFKDCSFLNYMKEKNYFTDIDENNSLEDIIKRDYIDSHREVDPLKKADDAIEIDSSNYNINEVTEIICNFIENALQ